MVKVRAKLHRQRFEIVRERVPCVEVANDLLSERGLESLVRRGENFRGACPLCHQGSNSEAFSCREDLFYCFSCGEGGDVITLAARANDMPPAMACAWLADRYSIELPARPEGWFQKQDRQARLRAALEEKKREVKRRRLFKVVMVPYLSACGADDEEVAAAWKDFERLPL